MATPGVRHGRLGTDSQPPDGPPLPRTNGPLLAHQHPLRLLLEIRVRGLLDRDPDHEDRTALECSRGLVLVAHGVAAVEPDAEAVAGEGELARLRAHGALGDDLVVDVELHVAERLPVRAGRVTDELHAE